MKYYEFMGYLDEYYDKLTRDYATGKIGHNKYLKSLGKLDEWEELFAERYFNDDDEEE